MKRYTVAEVRERLSEALDRADRGEPVVIERRGVRYELKPLRRARTQGKRRPRQIEIHDAAVAAGEWQWAWDGDGLRFEPREPRR
jgi:antitoxin (DNA-binding transcriptional repressor) of toxin-antitoxin stability system